MLSARLPVWPPCLPFLQDQKPILITIQQPSMTVSVWRYFDKAAGSYFPWMDVVVRLTAAPVAPQGVLGGTFPRLRRG